MSRFVMTPFLMTWVLFSAGLSMPAMAQIATDGTVGSAVSLSGPDFTISDTLGSQTGANLFHSFQTFHIQTGESATFTGPSGIDNVISRVTGGQESLINGLLRSTIPDADLWFLNPAGVMFGKNATVDLPGSLHVGTGDEVRFGDGAVYNAVTPAISTLTVAPPQAFGFLGNSPGVITVDQSVIELAPGKTLSLVGGNIIVTGARLIAGNPFSFLEDPLAGVANLISVSSPNAVNVSDGTTTVIADGTIVLTESSLIDTRGNGGGTVRIRAGTFLAETSDIRADNFGDLSNGGGVSIKGEVVGLINNSAIRAATQDSGDAVPISIEADLIVLSFSDISSGSSGTFEDDVGDGGDIQITATELILDGAGISSNTTSGSNGDGGSITIQTNRMEMSGSSLISTSANTFDPEGTGNAGSIQISAVDMVISGSFITSETGSQGRGGSITIDADRLEMDFSSLTADSGGFDEVATGDAGSIEVNVGELIMNFSSIRSDTQAFGRGGSVTINAERMELTSFSLIDSSSGGLFEDNATGDAGDVHVTANELTLDFSVIESNTSGPGNGGTVTIVADDLFITNRGASTFLIFSGIASRTEAGSTGNAGAIRLTVGNVTLVDGGQINSSTLGSGNGGTLTLNADKLEVLSGSAIDNSTFGGGDAGSLTVVADQIVLDSLGAAGFNGIVSQSLDSASGNAGVVSVTAGTLEIRGGSVIDSLTFGVGDAGSVKVQADTLTISGDGSAFFTGIASAAAGPRAKGDAGTVEVTAGDLHILDRGGISSPTEGPGKAGAVSVTADELEIRNGGSIDSSTFGAGDAGSVTVEADRLVLSGDGSEVFTGIASSAANPGFTGNAGEVVVTAGEIEVLDQAEISSSTFSEGDAGSVRVNADNVIVNGESSRIASESFAGGDAGSIMLTVGEIQILNDGLVSSTTAGPGTGGSIVLVADRLLIDDGSLASGTISDQLQAGDGGSIEVMASEIEILNGGLITVSTLSSGDGGSVTVEADQVLIEGSNESGQKSQIDSQTFVSGEAGSINVAAENIEIRDGGRIVASTTGAGAAGDIAVTADELVISGDVSGISSDSAIGATADAGSVTVTAGSVDISDRGLISTSVLNFGRASSGSVTVMAGDIRLSGGSAISTRNDGGGLGGDIDIVAANLMTISDSVVATTAAAGDGGRITLAGGDIDLISSEITTSVGGAGGDGGDITFNNSVLVQDNSTIRANAVGGDGGNITVNVKQLIQHPGRIAVIEATSALGISGDININTPETDAVGGVVVLTGDFLDTTALLDEPCAARVGGAETSSLVPVGRGGLPVSPDDPGSALYFADQAPGTGSHARLVPELQLPMRQYANVRWGCSSTR